MQQRLETIHDVCRGRWRGLLPQFGVAADCLDGKHHPCPLCGGKDRWRWNEQGRPHPGYHCNQCGHGNGVDLVIKLTGMQFPDAAKALREKAGAVVQEWKRASSKPTFDAAGYCADMWRTAQPLTVGDPAALYLRRRGLEAMPSQLRFLDRARYGYDDGRAATRHPAMLAQFVCPDAKAKTLHTTYLTADGRKAPGLPKDKKLAKGGVPKGGAVRLMPSAETMGIAEGIETALAASALHDLPVWSALNKELLMQWEPPKTAKHIIIFGDTDANFTGQAAAYALANRLRCGKKYEGWIESVEVRLPELADTDWNDVLMSEKGLT